MNWRPSLLLLTALAAGAGAVGNAVGLAASPEAAGAASSGPKTRLGVAIDGELSARDRKAGQRQRTLDLREQAVRAAEARMKANGEADAAAADPAGGAAGPAGAGGAEAPADQFDNLARIYQAMKPAAAAVVMEQLDIDVQMRVAQKMRERSTAAIMGAMTPKGAAALTMALARRGALPAAVPATAGRTARR